MFDCTCDTQNYLLLNHHNGDDAPQGFRQSCKENQNIFTSNNFFFRKSCRLWCYRCSCFEVRSKICSVDKQAKIREKNKVKFGNSSKRIYFVCNILVVYCEGVDFKVTGIKSDVWLTVHRNSVWIRKTN